MYHTSISSFETPQHSHNLISQLILKTKSQQCMPLYQEVIKFQIGQPQETTQSQIQSDHHKANLLCQSINSENDSALTPNDSISLLP